jgi:hypothetical protein
MASESRRLKPSSNPQGLMISLKNNERSVAVGAFYLSDPFPMIHKFTANARGKTLCPVTDLNSFASKNAQKNQPEAAQRATVIAFILLATTIVR